MIRITETFNNTPENFIVDDHSQFLPGMIAAWTVDNIGDPTNQKGRVGLYSGINMFPLGIIDDIRALSFKGVSWCEPVNVILGNKDSIVRLKHHNIDPISFISEVDVRLDAKNGTITIPKENQKGHFIVSYSYTVPNLCGDDSTLHSKRITVWTKNIIAKTDMFDTTQEYHKYNNLYVDERGLLTTRKAEFYSKCVGVVLRAPDHYMPVLKFLWDPNQNIEVGNGIYK